MEPGTVYEVEVDLEATDNAFGAGHRIRLEVSSSNFPRWARNTNSGGNNFDDQEIVVAENTVHHDAAHPSFLALTVLDD
jgi:putative CocE/NonD family hydrolase